MEKQELLIFDKKLSLTNEITFNFVFTEYYRPLVLFAGNFLNKDIDEAEDIVQDIFTILLQKYKEFDSLNSLKSFLYVSVKNACLNYNKHTKVKFLFAEEKRANTIKEVFFLNKVLEEEVYYNLVKAVKKLPNRCRTIFELNLDGLKNAEIASKMDISIETVKSQKKRGKKLLYKLVKPFVYFF